MILNPLPIFVMSSLLTAISLLLLVAERFLVTYGICNISINREKNIQVQGGDNLLSYFNINKIFIPSACGGKATCGFCKVKVLSGAGPILPTEEVYMTRDEKRQGIRLACQVKIRRDIDIYISESMLGAEEFSAEITDIRDLTHDIKEITLKLLHYKSLDFQPGQYIQFKIPGTDEFRAYSIASPPRMRSKIQLTVRLVPGGLCSSYMHKALDVGDYASFTGPFGEFFLRDGSQRDIVAIGGGCGMAPIRSIIYYLIEQGMPRRMFYFFGARGKKDLFYTEELEELDRRYENFNYIPALSEPKPEDKWEGETGLITQVVEKYIHNASSMESYLCGPPPMIDAAIRVLTNKGIPEEFIYYDKF